MDEPDSTPPTAPPLPPPPLPPPPTESSGPAARPPLRRAVRGRLLGGVAAGTALALGVPVWLVRVGVIIASLIGVGVPAYLVAWILVPDDAGRSVVRGGDRRELVAVGAVALVALAALGSSGVDVTRLIGRSLPWWLLLAGVALLLRRVDPAGATEPTAAATRPPSSTTAGPEGRATDLWSTGAPVDPDEVARVPAPPRPRPVVGPLTWCVVLVVVGVMGLLTIRGGDAGPDALGPGTMAAVAMLLFGGGLTLSAFRGRARGLLLPALAVGLALGGLAALDVRADTFAAPFDVRVTEVGDLADRYEAAAGSSVLDLSRLDLAASDDLPPTVRLSVTTGHLRVVLPRTVSSVVTATTPNGSAAVARVSVTAAALFPELTERWKEAGLPAPGSTLTDDDLDRVDAFGTLDVHVDEFDGDATETVTFTPPTAEPDPESGTTPTADADERTAARRPGLIIEAHVGVGDLVVVEPVWEGPDGPFDLPSQLCTVGGGPRGVVQPCDDVDPAQRVALCINDAAFLVDCREDRPGTVDWPRVAACRDPSGGQIDCAMVGIEPVGAPLISPVDDSSTDDTIAPLDPAPAPDPDPVPEPEPEASPAPDPAPDTSVVTTVAPAPTVAPIGG